jgi:hypothetical protein
MGNDESGGSARGPTVGVDTTTAGVVFEWAAATEALLAAALAGFAVDATGVADKVGWVAGFASTAGFFTVTGSWDILRGTGRVVPGTAGDEPGVIPLKA